jgi:hypothetical protein
MTRIKEILRDQTGNFLVGTLIGSVVTLLLVGAIGSAIVLLFTAQSKVGASNGATTEVTAVDAALRTDIRFASAIIASGDRAVSFTVPGEAGRCRTADWSVQEKDGVTHLVRIVTQYPEYDATVNPVQCVGTHSPAETTVMAKAVNPDTRFGYANAGGRELVSDAGALVTVDGSTRPASVPATSWGSNALASVSLTGTFGYGSSMSRSVRIHQGAPSLSSVIGSPDMPSHEVGDKSLRAG